MSSLPQRTVRPKPVTASRVQSPVLQRECACGHTAASGGECEGCRKKRADLQRRALPNSALSRTSSEAPEIVHDVLRSSGRPLDHATRTFMESRFGHDFSGVRVHTDHQAAASARAVHAEAYTVGRQIVFSNGCYSPNTSAGRRLIAHELAHVVQQKGHGLQAIGPLSISSATDHGEREAEQVSRAVTETGTHATGMSRPPIFRDVAVPPRRLRRRSIFDAIAGLFRGDTFSETDLQAYLTHLDTTGKIEDFNESDNKARAIVNAWRLGGSPYVLTARRKILLIKEMQSGFTGDDDELAILEILERSYNPELSMIFASISVEDLNSDFHGAEWDRLKDFYERRFEGGLGAMLKGQINPTGVPVRLGADLTKVNTKNDKLPGAVSEWNVPCVLGILCSQDKTVVNQLPTLTVKVADDIYFDDPYYDGSQWTTQRFDAGGFSSAARKLIGVRSKVGCPTVATTIVHEVRHQNQPPGWDVITRETDAYMWTERWSIDRGFPGQPEFRIRDPKTGKTIPYREEIERDVRASYPSTSSAAGEIVIGRTGAGDTEVRRPDGTTYTRPPQKGDKYSGPRTLQNERTIDPGSWVCPDTKLR